MSERATLGWVIVYVPEVERAVEFYERAFGLTRAFVDPTGNFGQLDTGSTALAFAAEALADGHLPHGVRRPGPDEPPANVELALVFDDVHAAFAHAVAEGCTALAEPAHAAAEPGGGLGARPLRDPRRDRLPDRGQLTSASTGRPTPGTTARAPARWGSPCRAPPSAAARSRCRAACRRAARRGRRCRACSRRRGGPGRRRRGTRTPRTGAARSTRAPPASGSPGGWP